MVPEMENDFDPWHAFIGEEFDHIASFHFNIIDTFSQLERLLPVYICHL
jgi:hypothetical protein